MLFALVWHAFAEAFLFLCCSKGIQSCILAVIFKVFLLVDKALFNFAYSLMITCYYTTLFFSQLIAAVCFFKSFIFTLIIKRMIFCLEFCSFESVVIYLESKFYFIQKKKSSMHIKFYTNLNDSAHVNFVNPFLE